jgi:hypothetical protein
MENSRCDTHQVLTEIAWTERKMVSVREEMIKRPSKIRHLRDLERQINERVDLLLKNGFPHLVPQQYRK